MNHRNLFQSALARANDARPPVWFMRQAGRYHAHYQELKKRYSFIELCKRPELACETTMGPIRDFDFDAAILFSDLLFPLEAMGMGLDYDPGPKLSWHLRERAQLADLRSGAELAQQLAFQGEAMRQIRAALDSAKGLLGFVGGPLTLYAYAVEGSHAGELASARAGLRDGRYEGFVEKLLDLLAENMAIQARSGADVIAMMDTCAGEFSPALYREVGVPAIREVLRRFHARVPGFPVLYYSKGTSAEHWDALSDLPISGIGIDWNSDVVATLDRYADRWAVQGNVDPNWLFLPAADLESRLRTYFARVKALPREKRRGWVCGLGHGVIQGTPEENVRLFIRLQRELFA